MRSFFISVPGCTDNSISITYWLQLIYGPFIHVVPLPDLLQLQTNVSVVGTTSSPQILLCYEVNWLTVCILKYRYCKCYSFCLLQQTVFVITLITMMHAVLQKIRSNTAVCALSIGGGSAKFLSTADRRRGTEAQQWKYSLHHQPCLHSPGQWHQIQRIPHLPANKCQTGKYPNVLMCYDFARLP